MVGQIDVQELAKMQHGGVPFVLLDVRDDEEYEIARIPGSIHIPAHDLADRLEGLSHDSQIIVMCHMGSRSLRAAQFLHTQGFRYVFNLEGGIDEYALEIDPMIPRY